MLVLILAISAFGQSPATHMAGHFLEPVELDGDLKKTLRNDDAIEFNDTVRADLDLNGLVDEVTRKNGLSISFQQADGSFRIVELNSEDGKIAVYDVNEDGFPDILQTTGFVSGGLNYYQNTAMKRLSAYMIPINEDGEGFYEYNNFSDSSKIKYLLHLSTDKIKTETARNGVKLYPEKNWHGTAELKIAYNNGTYFDTIHCPVLVLPVNDAPVFTSPATPLTLNEDTSLDIFSDSLLALAQDPDSGDVLSIYSLGEKPELSIRDSIFTYRPAANWNGDDSLQFVVTDGRLNDTLTLRLSIQPVNDAPQWTPMAAVEFPEDEYKQLPLSLFTDHAYDIETPDSLLRFYVYSGAHVVISAEGGAITLLGDKDWFGTDELTLVVSDGELRDTLIWSVNVTPVNDAPELSLLPDTLFNEDETIFINKTELEKYAFDIETGASDLKWQVKRFGKVRAFYNGNHIRCTASPDWYGTDSLELTVSDGELSASRIWKVHVLPVNDAPQWVSKNIRRSFLEDDTLHLAKRDLYKLVRDAETAPEDLAWTLVPGAPLTLTETSDEYLVYAEPNWYGNASIRIAINDGELGDTLDHELRILSVNDKPVMKDLEAKSWNEDDTLSIEKSYLRSLANDVETKKSDLMWAFINDRNLTVKDRPDAITLVPKRDWNGDARIGVIVYDGGLRDTGYMDITIKPVNDAPRWKAIPDTSIAEDGSLTIPLSYIRNYVYDPDEGDEIKLEYKAGKNFYVEEKTDTIVLWPMEDWYGKESVEFTASDGKKKIKTTWNIPVRSVNDAPYFTMGLPDSLVFSANGSDTLFFKDIVYDVDNKIEDLVWEISSGRIVRSTINEKLGAIIFYTENFKYGQDAVNIRVTDGHDQIVYYLPILVREVDRFLMANPERLELLPNTPNPFTDYTDIRYSLPVPANVNIKIYNLLGKEMTTLANGHHDAQNHSVRWYGETASGQPAPSGVYLCRMVAIIDGEPHIMMQKMMLVR